MSSGDMMKNSPPLNEYPDQAELDEAQRKKLVLVVDDDANIRRLVTLVLSPHYLVLEASNAQEALHWLDLSALRADRKSRIAVVLLDIMMPGLDGLKACRIIKRTFAVPIVMITALAEASFIEEALNSGADDYLVKPISASLLLQRVARWTE